MRVDDDVLNEAAHRGGYVDLTMGNGRSLYPQRSAAPPSVAKLMAQLGVTDFDDFGDFYESRIGVFTRLREHGSAVIAGVDSGMGPAKRHGSVWRMVGEQAEGSYPVTAALASGTSLAAEACGLATETGRLAAGTPPTCSW